MVCKEPDCDYFRLCGPKSGILLRYLNYQEGKKFPFGHVQMILRSWEVKNEVAGPNLTICILQSPVA